MVEFNLDFILFNMLLLNIFGLWDNIFFVYFIVFFVCIIGDVLFIWILFNLF